MDRETAAFFVAALAAPTLFAVFLFLVAPEPAPMAG